MIKRLLFALGSAGLIAGCTPKPVSTVSSVAPGIAATPSTYAIVAAPDEVSKAAARHVDERLRGFGYAPAASPGLLVEVSTAARSRTVGAFVPGCQGPEWTAEPERKKFFRGSKVLTLNVRVLDAKSQASLYHGSASLRQKGGGGEPHAAALAAAALPTDPRQAPVARAEPTNC
jgi:hypothetical protein